jgi:hypothetical protein
MKYEVTVGNIGTVITTDDKGGAERIYSQYVADSLGGIGRAGGEPVILWEDDEIIRHHNGNIDPEMDAALNEILDSPSYE